MKLVSKEHSMDCWIFIPSCFSSLVLSSVQSLSDVPCFLSFINRFYISATAYFILTVDIQRLPFSFSPLSFSISSLPFILYATTLELGLFQWALSNKICVRRLYNKLAKRFRSQNDLRSVDEISKRRQSGWDPLFSQIHYRRLRD